MNDPTEHVHDPRKAGGAIGRQREDGSTPSRLVFPDTAFIYCGSRETENEDLDRLDLWRAYGANGEGIAITTIWSKKDLAEDGLGVLKVEYVSAAQLSEHKLQSEKLQMEIDKATRYNHISRAKGRCPAQC